MEENSPSTLVTLLVNGLPLVVFIVVFYWMSRQYYSSRSGQTWIDIQVAVLEQMKVQNEALERIAAALEKKNSG